MITYGNVNNEDEVWQYLFQSVLHVMLLVYFVCLLKGGIMLVYDVTNQKSFDTITSSKWLQQVSISIISHSSHYLYQYTLETSLLVGNKVDFESQRVVPKKKGEELNQRSNISFVETSAVTGHNINEAFEILAKVSEK